LLATLIKNLDATISRSGKLSESLFWRNEIDPKVRPPKIFGILIFYQN